MGQDHAPDLVCELQTPRTEEGDKGGGMEDVRVVVLWVGEPSYLHEHREEKGEEEEQGVGGESGIVGIDAGCEEACFPSCGADVVVAGEDIVG